MQKGWKALLVAIGWLLTMPAVAFAVENRIVFMGWSSTATGLFVMDPDGSDVQLLAADAHYTGEPAWSPDGTKVAFPSDHGGNVEIDVLDLGTSTRTRLTNDAGAEGSPTWSPDGTRIAFSSDRDGDSEVYAMDSDDGLNVAKLTDNTVADFHPDWSPDGSQIAFVRAPEIWRAGEIWLMGPGGGAQTQLTRLSDSGCGVFHYADSFPDWSPDGTRIAYVVEGRTSDGEHCFALWRVNRDGSERTFLASNDFLGVDSPVWGAGGAEIAYIRGGDDEELHTVNSSGSGTGVVPTPNHGVYGIDWRALPSDETPSTHVRPLAASPLKISLVPAFKQCLAPNATHGPPLAFPSCTPPERASLSLTLGGDATPPASVGSVKLAVRVGAPGPPDESDVAIDFSLTNVATHADGAEYTGQLRTELTMRVTDKQNGVSSTMEDFPVTFPVQCVATSSPDEKGRCETSTTLDSLVPGAAAERSRAVWELRQVAVYHGIGEFLAGHLVAVSGLFVP